MKVCKECKETFSLDCFHKKGLTKTGKQKYRSICKCCYNKFQSKYYPIYKESDLYKLKVKDYTLNRVYGISLETYNIMLEVQNGVCAICHKANDNGKRLAVDHDHETGKVRQLLCSNCNTAIGLFKDNPQIVLDAANYLQKHTT